MPRIAPIIIALLLAFAGGLKSHGADLFDAPRRTTKELLAKPPAKERVVLSGVVVHSSPAIIVIHDATGAAFIHPAEGVPLLHNILPAGLPEPGTQVEISALHLSPRVGSPELSDGVWRATGKAPLPPVAAIPLAAGLSIDFDGRLIRVRGRLVDFETFETRGGKVSRVWLRSGEQITYGNFIGPEFAPRPAQIGQLIEIEGVANVSRVTPIIVRSYFVQLQSMAAARALPEPPPWTDPTFMRGLLISAVLLAAAGAWVFFLRRQVRSRTALLAESEKRLRLALDQERELGELKTNFVSMVSHELRTPLEVTQSSADILSRYLDRLPADERAVHLDAIQSSVKRMAGMMEEVLVLSRLDASKLQFQPEQVHLVAWCQRLVDEMRSATAGRCVIEFSAGGFEPLVHADAALLRHIFTNLLSNAVKYSAPAASAQFTVERRGGDAIFRVIDHGIGIPRADQARLFEAFHRGSNSIHTPGTGLGLVIVKRCVDLHCGQIAVQSEEGRGTTVTVTLPLFTGQP